MTEIRALEAILVERQSFCKDIKKKNFFRPIDKNCYHMDKGSPAQQAFHFNILLLEPVIPSNIFRYPTDWLNVTVLLYEKYNKVSPFICLCMSMCLLIENLCDLHINCYRVKKSCEITSLKNL